MIESNMTIETDLRRARLFIEELAEERHMLHGASRTSFWNCSRNCCRKAAEFLRGEYVPMLPEEAQAAYDAAVPIPVSQQRIEEIVEYVMRHADDREEP